MQPRLIHVGLILCALQVSLNASGETLGQTREFPARGIIETIQPQTETIVIKHEAISNYMDAMTMPFTVKQLDDLSGLERGDQITFLLHVSSETSWVDHFSKIGAIALSREKTNSAETARAAKFELLHYRFTNELDQPVSLSDFPGQALAITFIYTRCPLPNFCPRLSENFAVASKKLEAMPNAPTNWHFISVSFDPEYDSPEVLRGYAQYYHYDPAHWSLLTGPSDKIEELASRSGITVKSEDGTLNHNFRTLIIDASGRLQTVFPITGDLSDMIVENILKAAVATNALVEQKSDAH